MNLKADFIKQSERIIYLVLIVALVIALITISTCNIGTKHDNVFLTQQVDVLAADIKDLEGNIDSNNLTIKGKAEEIKEKNNKIQDLIKKGEITSAEAQRRIRELRAQLSGVKEELILQQQVGATNTDSLGAIIAGLKRENSTLQKRVDNLNEELSKKPNTVSLPMALEEDWEIFPSSGTKITKNSISVECELTKNATQDEFIYVEVLDEYGVNANPQKQSLSFTISRGTKYFKGSVLTFEKSIFKPGKQYTLVFRDAKYKEKKKYKVTVPKFIFGKGVAE